VTTIIIELVVAGTPSRRLRSSLMWFSVPDTRATGAHPQFLRSVSWIQTIQNHIPGPALARPAANAIDDGSGPGPGAPGLPTCSRLDYR